MTDFEKYVVETPITIDCFEMDNFENVATCEDTTYGVWRNLICDLEELRQNYNETKDKRYLKELIRLLPNSYKVVKL